MATALWFTPVQECTSVSAAATLIHEAVGEELTIPELLWLLLLLLLLLKGVHFKPLVCHGSIVTAGLAD